LVLWQRVLEYVDLEALPNVCAMLEVEDVFIIVDYVLLLKYRA